MKDSYKLVFTLIALYACVQLTLPYLDVLTYAAISTTLLYPVYLKLKKIGREFSAIVCTLLVFVAVIIPVSYTASFGVSQTKDAYHFLVEQEIVPVIPAVSEILNTPKLTLLQQSAPALSVAIGIVSKIPEFLVKLLLFTFMTYYFFYDGTNIKRFIQHAFGGFGKTLVKRGELHLKEVVFGNFLNTLVIAGISIAILLLWKIPYAYTLGALVGIFAVAPLLSVWMIFLPLAYAYYQTKPFFALTVLTYAAIVGIGMFDVFLRNRLIKGMHPAIFTLGFFGGLSVFGIPGMFIGPVLLSLSIAVIETYTISSKA